MDRKQRPDIVCTLSDETLGPHRFDRQKVFQELKNEIAKGWDGPDSSKAVQDIINEKQDS